MLWLSFPAVRRTLQRRSCCLVFATIFPCAVQHLRVFQTVTDPLLPCIFSIDPPGSPFFHLEPLFPGLNAHCCVMQVPVSWVFQGKLFLLHHFASGTNRPRAIGTRSSTGRGEGTTRSDHFFFKGDLPGLGFRESRFAAPTPGAALLSSVTTVGSIASRLAVKDPRKAASCHSPCLSVPIPKVGHASFHAPDRGFFELHFSFRLPNAYVLPSTALETSTGNLTCFFKGIFSGGRLQASSHHRPLILLANCPRSLLFPFQVSD